MVFEDCPSSGLPPSAPRRGEPQHVSWVSWLRKSDTTWGFTKPPPTWHSNLQGASSPKRISAVRLARCKGLTTNSSGEALRFWRLIQGDVAVNLQWCRVDIEFPSTLILKPSIYCNLWSQFFLHHYIHIIRSYNVDQYLQASIRFTFWKSASVIWLPNNLSSPTCWRNEAASICASGKLFNAKFAHITVSSPWMLHDP